MGFFNSSSRGANLFCAECGARLSSDSLFCAECGTPVGGTRPEMPGSVPPPAVSIPLPTPVSEPAASAEMMPASAAVSEEKICPDCGTSIEADSNFCWNCGHVFEAILKRCGKCNAILPEGCSVCGICGQSVNGTVPPSDSAVIVDTVTTTTTTTTERVIAAVSTDGSDDIDKAQKEAANRNFHRPPAL